MDVTQLHQVSMPKTFAFTFTPTLALPPEINTQRSTSSPRTTADDDTTRPGGTPPAINLSSKPHAQAYNEEAPRPQASHSPARPSDDMINTIQRIVNESLGPSLSAISEERNMLERWLIQHVNVRIEILRGSSTENLEKRLNDLNGHIQQSLEAHDGHIGNLNNCVCEIQRTQGEFSTKTEVHATQQKLRNEINNESLRAQNEAASIRNSLDDVLARLLTIESAHSELKSLHTNLRTQHNKLKSEHAELKTQHDGLRSQLNNLQTEHDDLEVRYDDLETQHNEFQTRSEATTAQQAEALNKATSHLQHAQSTIVSLQAMVSRQDSMLNTMKVDVAEATRRANFAIYHVQRWVDGEMRAQQTAEEERQREMEAERQRQEAEDARLREEARKAHDQARKEQQERNQREAQEEKARARQEREKREKEQEERAEREREREKRRNGDHNILSRWALYDAPLAESLTFNTIIWPVLIAPVDPDDLTLSAIRDFLFSKAHSEKKDNKQRLWDAFKRWHSDKCATVKARVPDEEKPLIDEAFHVISIHLNELNAQMKADGTTA
ncbi:unnamed protein product [Peniophora sp. CBMAI 1063]|nr:unnamed protein product [Peniophora sp. CBMAI 1063]